MSLEQEVERVIKQCSRCILEALHNCRRDGNVTVDAQEVLVRCSPHRCPFVRTNAMISSGGGNVQVNGIGGGSGSAPNCYGVFVSGGGKITSMNLGTVTVFGSGGNGNSLNHGVFVIGTTSMITSAGSDIFISGIAGNGNSSAGISTNGSGTITTAVNGGDITLNANSMIVGSALATNSSSSLTMASYTPGVIIELGITTNLAAGPYVFLMRTDLVTTGTLIIGDVIAAPLA